jgi:L-iditol 2-dehydrogenase
MKVAVYYRNDDIRIEERPDPQISENEILVRMKASGICGTDVMQWYRIKKAPRILGHEMAGEIAEAGATVQGLKRGDRVFVSHHVPCYNCNYCSQDLYTACETLHAGNYDPGGFSELIRVPEQNVKYGTFLLPRGVTFADATMVEPLGCAIAGQRQADLKKGQTVLIIGSGISGLLHIQLSKRAGATVLATDINEYRLNKAREFGADYVFDARDYSIDLLKEKNNNHLADVVIVCAGASKAVEDAISSVNRKGMLLFFAVPQGDMVFPSQEFWRNEVTVAFTYGAAPEDLREAIEMIDTGAVDVKRMVTHQFPLSEIQVGFRMVAEASESLKVVVVPD